jgi:hypothetical protein
MDYVFQWGDCEGKEQRGKGKAFTQVLTARPESLMPVAWQKLVSKGRGERVGVLFET